MSNTIYKHKILDLISNNDPIDMVLKNKNLINEGNFIIITMSNLVDCWSTIGIKLLTRNDQSENVDAGSYPTVKGVLK